MKARKLTPTVQRAIVRGIKLGSWKKDFCWSAGIHPATFDNWMTEGERLCEREESELTDDERAIVAFFAVVKRADAQCKEERLRRIRGAGKDGQWQADAWFLERRFPGEFGRRVDVGVGPRTMEPFTSDEAAIAADELAKWRTTVGRETVGTGNGPG